EDGIRDFHVTGVQTCALPILEAVQGKFGHSASPLLLEGKLIVHYRDMVALDIDTGKEAWRVSLRSSFASPVPTKLGKEAVVISRSEERRVGKECRRRTIGGG